MKTSNTFIEGQLVAIIEKPERKNEETGEITKAHQVLQFIVDGAKAGFDVFAIKDLDMKYKDVKVGQEVKVGYVLTAMINGNKYHKVV